VPSLKEQFGIRLRFLRHSRGLTQEQFAELVGISVDFLSLVERGINAPSFPNIEQIASRLGVIPAALFTFPGNPSGGGSEPTDF
jgi:transcriptional regulator with XRE-family HTH domain